MQSAVHQPEHAWRRGGEPLDRTRHNRRVFSGSNVSRFIVARRNKPSVLQSLAISALNFPKQHGTPPIP